MLGAKTSKNLKSIRSKHLAISDEEIEVVLEEDVNQLNLSEEKEIKNLPRYYSSYLFTDISLVVSRLIFYKMEKSDL